MGKYDNMMISGKSQCKNHICDVDIGASCWDFL